MRHKDIYGSNRKDYNSSHFSIHMYLSLDLSIMGNRQVRIQKLLYQNVWKTNLNLYRNFSQNHYKNLLCICFS